MTGSDGGAEREARFVNLLQPNRDMATNWAVDVGKQLENYLDELKAAGLFDDGECPLNFAEAALLIQGSIQVYSRKVEYLYNLVLRALDFLAQKKQGQEGEKPSSQENDQDRNAANEEEENFLNMDDEVPEEADIDVLDEEGVGSINPAVKVPACLLVTEAESVDMSGDAGELASYYVATCTMYRNFLLLDPSDAETVDKYLDNEELRRSERGGASAAPNSDAFADNSTTPGLSARQPAGNLGTTNGPPGEGTAAENKATTTPGGMDVSNADWQGDGDEGMAWDDLHADEEINDNLNDPVPGERESRGTEAAAAEHDHYIDPWTPLDPHEPGALPIKPFQKGLTQRKLKPKKDKSAPVSIARRTGVCFPEFVKALQAREQQDRATNIGKEDSLFERLRRSFFRSKAEQLSRDPPNEDGLGGSSGDSDNEDNDWNGDYNTPDHSEGAGLEPNVPPVAPPEVYPDDINSFRPQNDGPGFDQGVEDENISLEDLCQAHVDSVLQKLAETQVRSGLTARVTSWKNKIEATLREDESRLPFDIHEYGDQLLETLVTTAANRKSKKGEGVHESFTNLVCGQPKDQVARSFSALLQLVNNGNVMIEKGKSANGSYCFTAENPFQVKLINPQNCHKGMFHRMIPPVNAARGSSRSKASQHQTPTNLGGLSQRVVSPIMISGRVSPVLPVRTPRSGLNVGNKSPIFMSPGSVRQSSRKRGQSIPSNLVGATDSEIRSFGTPNKGYTPVKLTPNRRQSKRKPLQAIQV